MTTRSKDGMARFLVGFSHRIVAGRGRMHAHDGMEVVFHAAGEGAGRAADGSAFRFFSGSVSLYGAGLPHAQDNTRAGQDFCLVLHRGGMAAAPEFGRIQNVGLLVDDCLRQEILSLAATRIVHDAREQRICDLRVTAVLLTLLELRRRPGPEKGDRCDAALAAAQAYIQAHFDAIGSVAEVAAHVGLSPDYLRHRFRLRFGVSPRDSLLRARLDHARDLLRHTSLPQKAIAVQCGFGNIRYFNTRFKHHTGMTPGSCRLVGDHGRRP
ncbi:MAG: hypothetical protein A3K19_26230 [Lentisphaerae bacterium RIFOXYB12_FULL_65_16]|nr:MAG: hypothetical protein A3K18_29695 [Lentisphaerae bacterium RIFOXYA12_64_32]OGV87773.1 MAG: hypothetical protein A3K19_26230 [Lentisphaerae bacterium RIFOXYB12_FULL_65_16]